jgi:hypothetical protein
MGDDICKGASIMNDHTYQWLKVCERHNRKLLVAHLADLTCWFILGIIVGKYFI